MLLEPPELAVAADRLAVDQDLRNGRAPRQLAEPQTEVRLLVDPDLLVRKVAPLEQRLCALGVAAPVGRVRIRTIRAEIESQERFIPRSRVYTGHVASRTVKTEAVVLRSLRFAEADRILHLFTRDRGRVGAIAKGARRTRSRVGARLEPFSYVEIMLHEGRGELSTVTGVDLIRPHHAVRERPYALAVGHIGLEATLRLFIEHDPNPPAFHALVRFLDLLDESAESAAEPALDPLGLGFQLKLLWLAGYLPHLTSCASCDGRGPLVAFSPAAGGAVCEACRDDSLPVSASGFEGIRSLLEHSLAEARAVGPADRGAREALRAIEALYEYHGGFRLRTLARR